MLGTPLRDHGKCVGAMTSSSRLCPEGVGVRLADDGLRSGPKTRRPGLSDIPSAQGLLPLRGRSSASQTPTASGQNQTDFRHTPTAFGQNQTDFRHATLPLLPKA